MGEQLCQIFLDNQWSAFYAGQVVTGHVKINLRKEKKLRGESTINKYVQVFCTVIPISSGFTFAQKKQRNSAV